MKRLSLECEKIFILLEFLLFVYLYILYLTYMGKINEELLYFCIGSIYRQMMRSMHDSMAHSSGLL